APITRAIAAGGMGESLGGIAVIALSIAGLAGAAPLPLGSIAVIVAALALMWQSGVVLSEFRVHEPAVTSRRVEVGEAAEFFGGATGIVFGVLALAGVHPSILIAATAVLF